MVDSNEVRAAVAVAAAPDKNRISVPGSIVDAADAAPQGMVPCACHELSLLISRERRQLAAAPAPAPQAGARVASTLHFGLGGIAGTDDAVETQDAVEGAA